MPEADRQRWNATYERREGGAGDPSSFLTGLAPLLATTGAALDLAGGLGGNALWMAERGLAVTLADVSDVALSRAEEAARERGLRLRTSRVDLEAGELPRGGPWDVVVQSNFLWRPLFKAIPGLLAPGGVFVFCQPTRSNLERNPRPSARFLLEDGELPGLLEGLEIVRHWEGWTADGRHEARLVAKRRSESPG